MVSRDESKDAARAPAAPGKAGSTTGAGGSGGNVGNALRSVYDETLQESVPDEMLDLLGKLN